MWREKEETERRKREREREREVSPSSQMGRRTGAEARRNANKMNS